MSTTLVRIVAFALCAACALPAFPLEPIAIGEPIFTTVGNGESIPGLIVASVAQDRTGFLWLGTHEGLIRYDGNRFRLFRHDPKDDGSLSDNVIRVVQPGDDGRIWVATNNGGVSVFDPRTERFRRLRSGAGPNALVSDDARALVRGDGGMWVGTRSALHFVEYATFRIERRAAAPAGVKSPRRDSIGSLLVDRRGDLWIGSAEGLAVRRKNGSVEIVDGPARAWLVNKPVFRLFEAADGTIWIALFGGGVAMLDPSTLALRVVDDKFRGLAFAQPTPSEIWIGASGAGVSVRDAATGEPRRTLRHDVAVADTIDSDRVSSLFVDRGGVLWVGLWGRGLNRHLPGGAIRVLPHSPTRAETLGYADVGCVLEARDGTIWVGTRGNGVDILDRTRGRIGTLRAPAQLADDDVPSLAQTADGAIWIGTDMALHRHDPLTQTTKRFTIQPFDRPMGTITTLKPSADGAGLWVGTTGGLAYFDLASETAVAARYGDGEPVRTQLSDIVEDRNGVVWAATQGGLAARLPGAAHFVRYTRERNTNKTLSATSVLGLLVDRTGRLWVGTANGLDRLVRFDAKTAAFEPIAPRIGRDGKRGENLLEDAQGRIWVDGETVFDPKTFEHYDLAESEGGGRVVWRGAAAKSATGELLLGGADGVLIVDPSRVRPPRIAPPIAVSAIRIDGAPRVAMHSLRLEPRNRSFSVEFAALDFSAPERNRYAYRLAGFETEWNETDASRRTAAYTALAPGDYVLEVRGTNRAGVWSADVLRVPVSIKPAFWQTLAFRIVAVLTAIALMFQLFRLRVRYLEARKAELEQQVRERTVELDRAARTDFLTGLSNRRDLLEIASRLSTQPFAVILGDVDNFKRLNDELGHDAGDSALKHVADCIRAQTRRGDVAARWGGEEFLVYMPASDEENAASLAERMRAALQGTVWMWDGRSRFVTMTFGVAASAPGASVDDAVRRADEALYVAKREGKNRVMRALNVARAT